MKLAFLNSCLEPGRDGVGDYTRSLAQECRRQGHECCLVALNDRYASELTTTNADDLNQLRLPATMPWPERIQAAQEMLDAFAPDWVSLQFVPYAFHPKGFVPGLGQRLRPLLTGRQVQVMFHELWLGETQDASLKHRLIGKVQKSFVRQMLRQTMPQVVHTSNNAYVSVLARNGVQATRLPLFGNVPVTAQSGAAWLFEALNKEGVPITEAAQSEFWLAGFFGSLHPIWPPEPLFGMLHDAAIQAGRRVVLLSIGRLGPGEALWDAIAEQYSPQFHFCKLGEQPAEKISQYLDSLDFGIATSPYSLIGKSGSVAAMLEHGLPVIVNRDDAHFDLSCAMMPEEPLLHKMEADFACKLTAGLPHAASRARLPDTAGSFLKSLEPTHE